MESDVQDFKKNGENKHKSASELKQEADSLYKQTRMSEEPIRLQDYQAQRKAAEKREYEDTTTTLERIVDKVNEFFGNGKHQKFQASQKQLESVYMSLENKLDTLKGDYASHTKQRDVLQKEIQKTGTFIDASQNHYDILLERRDSLEAQIQTMSSEASEQYTLHQKRDELLRITDELVDRYTQTEEGFEMYDTLRAELSAVDDHMVVLRKNIAAGQKQKTNVKIAIQRNKMFSKYHSKDSESFVKVYENVAVLVEKLQEQGAPKSSAELTVDKTYTLGRDKELSKDYRNVRWNNTPPPV